MLLVRLLRNIHSHHSPKTSFHPTGWQISDMSMVLTKLGVKSMFKSWSMALRSLSSKPKTYLQVPIPLSDELPGKHVSHPVCFRKWTWPSQTWHFYLKMPKENGFATALKWNKKHIVSASNDNPDSRLSPALSWLCYILPSLPWPVVGQARICLGLLLSCVDF